MRGDNQSNPSPQISKTKDQAFVLPIIGLIFLIPPFASVFQIDSLVAGIPLTVLYLFGVWGLLILGAALLSRRLRLEIPSHNSKESDAKTDD